MFRWSQTHRSRSEVARLLPLALGVFVAALFAAVAYGLREVQYQLLSVQNRDYRAITDQQPLGELAGLDAAMVETFHATSPRKLAQSEDHNPLEAASFFASTGLYKREAELLDALPADARSNYPFLLSQVVSQLISERDYGIARYHAQRLINLVASMEPSGDVFHYDDDLDRARKVIRFVNGRFPYEQRDLLGCIAKSEELTSLIELEDEDEDEVTSPALADYAAYCEAVAEDTSAAWETFIADHPDSPLREDAEFNLLVGQINDARRIDRNDLEFRSTLTAAIQSAHDFAGRYRSALADDALLYELRMSCHLDDPEHSWHAFQRLAELRGVADSTLKVRYLIMSSPAVPYGTTEAQSKLLDAFMLRAVRASERASTEEIAGGGPDGEQTLMVLSLVLSTERQRLDSLPAAAVARDVLRRCIAAMDGI